MTGPGDGVRLLLTVLFAAWSAAFVFAFYGYVVNTDEAGRDPVRVFLGWQGVAGVISFAIFGVSRQWPKRSGVRKLAVGPMIIAVLVALGILGVAIWARSS